MRTTTIRAAIAAICVTASLPSFAAQNCISNGDFESPVANYNHNTGYSYNSESGNGGKPTGWTLSPANRTGRVNEGTTRFGLFDLMGKYSMFLERQKVDTAGTFTEAKQSFSVPAPGKYRLSLNCCNWAPENTYAHLNAFAQLIQPGGVVTNALKNFKPNSFAYGLEGIRSFAVDTETLTTYGAGNNYTLRFYATEKPSSVDYAYNVIDNVNFSLRTLVLGANETFTSDFGLEPHDMELGADSTLTYAPTSATTEILGGKVTFTAGAKLIFDMASASAAAYMMRTGGFVLPEGESDPLDFIELANAGDYALSLIEDGKTVLIAKASAPVSVTWTGAGDPSSLLDADNWSAVPNASTLTVTLGTAADWRGLGLLAVSPAVTIDMNGNALTLSGLSSAEFTGAAITNSASGAAAVLTVDVAAGATNENKTVAILGNVRLVKEGVGGFKASKIGQTYWGGTSVNGGTLVAGAHGRFRPFGAGKNLIANADFEANELPDTWSYRYTSAIPGTEIVGWTPSATSYTGLVNAYFYWTQYVTVANDPQYEWYGYALFFSNNRAAWQTFHVDEPGTYRFVFEYGPWIDTATYDRPPTTVTISGGGETQLTAVVTPVAEVGYRQFFADVEIVSADDYTLRFDAIGISGNRYIAFDNVSFAPKCEIAVGAGATLDMNGHEGYGMYSITVAGGGTLMNSGSEMTSEKIGFADVTFADNHVLQLTKLYPISGYGAAVASFDLGGKTNSVAIPTGKNFSVRDAEIKNGTFNVTSGGWLQIDGTGVDASTADLIVGSALRPNAPLTVRNYRYSFKHAKCSGRDGNTTDVLLMHDGDEDHVLATVTPETTNVFATCSGFVRIEVGGTYKFRICARKQTSTVDLYNVFDNISFTFIPEVKLTGGDAVLDVNGKYWLYDNFYVLNGGTVRNTGGNPGDSRSKIQYVELSRDSSFAFASTYGIYGESARPALMDMGGYTLNATVGNGQTFWLNSTVMTGEGRVVIPATTGTLRVSDQGGQHIGLVATNVDFFVGCALNLNAPMNVGGYEALYEGTSNAGTAALNVFGTFRPVTSNYYGCVLQDGATIKVKRGAKGGKIVSWNEKPSNFDTLTFVRDPSDERRYSVTKKDDGIYVQSGFMLTVR